jgi:hypothetical protein
LTRHDLLLMPTTPMKATPIPPQDAPLALYCQRAFEMLPNTAPFDVSGHPAMNVPCGMSAGLPVGMQLVGAHYASRRSTAPRTPSSSSATGATSSAPKRSPRAHMAANPFRSDWLAGGARRRLRPQGTLSYVSGSTDEPLRFITISQQLDKTVAATARATRRSSTPRACACRGTT